MRLAAAYVTGGWTLFIAVLVVLGVAPGAVLRLLVLAYPNGHPRRHELLAELYTVPYIDRPLFVAQQLETVLFEGIPARRQARQQRPKRASVTFETTKGADDGINTVVDEVTAPVSYPTPRWQSMQPNVMSPLRRKLGTELRRLRQAVSLSASEAAERLQLSTSKLVGAEAGTLNVHVGEIEAMLHLYGLDDRRKRDALLTLARRARYRGWWDAYHEILGPEAVTSISLEARADSIHSFQTLLIPGPFQTEEYCSALAAASSRGFPFELSERLDEACRKRQQILLGRTPVPVHIILDESLLHRKVGGRTVMRAQLEQLLQLADADNVTLQVLSYQGAHVGLGGAFTLFGFAAPIDELAIVQIENQRHFILDEDKDDVRQYNEAFHQLQRSALSVSESLVLVKEIAERL